MSNHLPKGLTFPEHYLTYGITIFSRPQDATGAADFDNEAAIRIAEQEVVSTQATLSEVTQVRGIVPGTVALMLASVIAVAGCSSGGDSTTGASSTVSSSTPTSADAPLVNRDPLPEPIRNDAPKHRLEDRLTAVQELPGDPDWLAMAAGHLWVKRDDGQVSQVDLRTAKPTGEWATGYSGLPACQGLAYDGSHLWSCAGENRLARHDPAPGGAADQFRVSRLGDQTRVVPSNDLLWVINAEATGLAGLNGDTGKVESTIELGTFCIDLARPLAQDTGTVYAICPTDGLVLAVDVAQERVTGRLRLNDARAATISDDLWVVFARGLAQIDPQSLQVIAVYNVNLGILGEIWADADDVWARAPGKAMLTHIDPRQHRFVETLTSTAYPSGGDVLVVGDDLWTTASDDGVLLTIRLPS
jgi:hypothetical protein